MSFKSVPAVKTNIDTKDFSINYVYRIFGNIAFDENISYFDKSIKYIPYFEVFIPTTDPGVFNIYTTFTTDNSYPNALITTNSDDLTINDSSLFINDKRIWMMDFIVQLKDDLPDDTPLYVSIPFKNINNIFCTFNWVAQVIPSNGNPYTISQIQRKTIWVYKPKTEIYMLINISNGNLKIYVMQSFTNQIDQNLNPTNINYMGNKLSLPIGWLWTSLVLNYDTYLKVVSTGTAYLVQDNLKNSYEYLDPKYAPWLYSNFSYLNVV